VEGAAIKVNNKTQAQAVRKAANQEWVELGTQVQVTTALPGTPVTAIADDCSFAHYEIPYSLKQNERI